MLMLLFLDPKQKTEYVDEYFAIDPPIEKIENDTFSFSLDEELHEKLMLRKSRYNNSNLKNNDVEKYLRITSGPIIRNQHHFQQQNKKAIDRSYTFKPHSNFIGNNQKLNQIQENKRYDHPTELRNSTLKVQGITKISYSATSRMPPILNIKFLKETELPQSGKPSVKSATTKFSSTNHYDEIDEKRSRKCINTLGLLHPATLISSKSATFSSKFNKLNSKNQNIIQLPALHRNLDFNSEIVGRSISALCKK